MHWIVGALPLEGSITKRNIGYIPFYACVRNEGLWHWGKSDFLDFIIIIIIIQLFSFSLTLNKIKSCPHSPHSLVNKHLLHISPSQGNYHHFNGTITSCLRLGHIHLKMMHWSITRAFQQETSNTSSSHYHKDCETSTFPCVSLASDRLQLWTPLWPSQERVYIPCHS